MQKRLSREIFAVTLAMHGLGDDKVWGWYMNMTFHVISNSADAAVSTAKEWVADEETRGELAAVQPLTLSNVLVDAESPAWEEEDGEAHDAGE